MPRPRKWMDSGEPLRTVEDLEQANEQGRMLWVSYGTSYAKAHHPKWVRNWNYSVVINALRWGKIRYAQITPAWTEWRLQRAKKALGVTS